MSKDWILRVGNGANLIRSSPQRIWGIQSTNSFGKFFTRTVKPGDRLWFVKSKSHGKILAAARYHSHNRRELGPLVNLTPTNEELQWDNEDTDWMSDTEIHYTDLYNVSMCELLTHIKGPSTIRVYDSEKCRVNLPAEYEHIVKYSKVTNTL